MATLAPVVLLALLTDVKLSSALASQRDAELGRLARHYGHTLFERLAGIDDLLIVAHDELRGRTPLAQLLQGGPLAGQTSRLQGLARLDANGHPLEVAGVVPALTTEVAALRPEVLAALAEGRSAVVASARPGDAVVLLRATPLAAPPLRYVAASVRPTFLWSHADQTAALTGYCVVVGQTRLDCPAKVPAVLPVEQVAVSSNPALGWTVDGETLRAGGWTLPIDSRFAGEHWTVFAVQPAAAALAPTREFRAGYIPIAIVCLLVMLVVAARQARRISEPIRELLVGTQRLARRDFTSKVAVTGNDEISQLAAAFNAMAGRLALQFGTLQAMTKIDRAILNSVDLTDVALNSVRCLRHIVDTDLISVGLLHPESPHRLLVQTRRRGAKGIEKLELHWPDAEKVAEGTAPALPADYERHLARRDGKSLRVLPISRGGSFWGVIVLGEKPGQSIDPDRASLLSGVVDRLAVALSTAARDWRLHVQAHYDPLTGLPNRAHLLTLLTQHIAMARREQLRGAVLFLDLDRFKQINDTLGHAAGDELLRLAAERIRLTLRESDMVARIGGDEFTVVLPKISSSRDAGQVATNLINALNKPFEIDGQKLYAGGSVGIAQFPEDGDTAEDLLKRADTAMYRAKELGRGRHAFFQESMGLELSARATLDRELRQALEKHEFVLHYQPQIDLATGAVTGAEALLRWRHPSRGLLGPGEFIDFAEESGLIERIGEWVLRQACEQHRQWETIGLGVPCVAVNVSNRQLRQPGFLNAIDLALVRAQRDPSHLEIEITESLLMDGGEAAMRVLNGLKQAGVNVAIDDFGTGYSSFAYLRTLPATVLKLDRSFVVDIATDQDAAVIAASMIHMARTLRKTVVVEGVETQEQLAVLAEQGAHRIQGYLISRPLPAAQFEQFIRDYESNRIAHAQMASASSPSALSEPSPAREAA